MLKVIVISLFCSFYLFANECVKVKGAFDIGSGSTKLKVARVDTCLQKIKEVLFNERLPVGYAFALSKSPSSAFNSEVVDQGIKAINQLKTMAKIFSPESYNGVATSAFRNAVNGNQVLKKIKAETGVSISIIDQDLEAKIGFAGASAYSKGSIDDLVTWDIGGGSMQITSYQKNGSIDIYRGKLAAVSFMNHIIQEVQFKNVDTANPISEDEYMRSLRDARIIAKVTVQNSIKQKLSHEKSEIIGIGGVLSRALADALGKKELNPNDLELYIQGHLDLTDEQLGGKDFVENLVSNFILVLGFMRALDIEKMKVADVNLADGIIAMPGLIKK